MKIFILGMIAALSFQSAALAAKSKTSGKTQQQICDSLQEQIDDECAHIMCDDLISDGTFADLNECVGGSDYAEAAQGACEDVPTLEDLVKQYNKKHGVSLRCE